MVFSLTMLPDDMLQSVLQKTTIESLCRLRRSDKRLDSFVEENRSHIRVLDDFCTGKPKSCHSRPLMFKHALCLQCSVSVFTTTREAYCTIRRRENEIDYTFSVNIHSLSAIHFKRMTITVDEKVSILVPESTKRAMVSLEKLKNLRISCETLTLCGKCDNEAFLEEVLSVFSFTKLVLFAFTSLGFWLNPIIQRCVEAEFSAERCNSTPDEVITALSQMHIPEIHLNSSLSFPMSVPRFVEKFLEELKMDKRAKGDMQRLRLESPHRAKHLPMQYNVWQGSIMDYLVTHLMGLHHFERKFTLCFSEYEDGVVLIINERHLYVDLHFIEDSIQETVLLKILELLNCIPYDLSTAYNDLKISFDFKGTIQNIMETVRYRSF